MTTCASCRHWLNDVTNPQDRGMEAHDRRPCSLANSEIERGTFYHSTTPACRKYSVCESDRKKEVFEKRIAGAYAALGKSKGD